MASSTDGEPGPVSVSASTSAIRTTLYSKPPSLTQGPFFRWTRLIAVSIVAVRTDAATGVAAPSDQQRAAAGLGGAGGQRVALTGPQPEVLEELTGALEAVAPEPAEQLLGAVTDEEAAHDKAEKKASKFH